VPWNRVPQVRRIAHEWYEPLVCHRSLTKLLFQFVFDRELTLLTRVRRSDRGANRLAVPAHADAG
jgi:sphingolipid delta-4 desaturase